MSVFVTFAADGDKPEVRVGPFDSVVVDDCSIYLNDGTCAGDVIAEWCYDDDEASGWGLEAPHGRLEGLYAFATVSTA